MDNKVYAYPIYITTNPEEEFPYFVEIPDVNGFTQGKDLADAITMARDYIGFVGADRLDNSKSLPLPDKVDYHQNDAQIKTLVDINFKKYKQPR